MLTNIRYVLLCAIYDRLFAGLIALVVVAGFISYTLASAAFLEQNETALVFTAASSRLILVIGAIVFVCFHIRASFDSREMDVMLSRPVSRDQVVLSHWLGYSLISVLLVMPVLALLLLLGAGSATGLAAWTVSMIVELWFIVAFAQFCAFIMRSAVASVLASLAFYVLSRMIILFVMTAEHSLASHEIWLVSQLLVWLSVIIPRLDLFAKTEWLLYGTDGLSTWMLFAAQGGLYIAIFLVACILDFRKKTF